MATKDERERLQKEGLDKIRNSVDKKILKEYGKPIKIVKAGKQELILWKRPLDWDARGKGFQYTLTKHKKYEFLATTGLVKRVGEAEMVATLTKRGFKRQKLGELLNRIIYNEIAKDKSIKILGVIPNTRTRSQFFYKKMGFKRKVGDEPAKWVGDKRVRLVRLKPLKRHKLRVGKR